MTKQRIGLGLLIFTLGALLAAVAGLGIGGAEQEGRIGYVNIEVIWENALRPALEPPLLQETQRLQAELDERVEGKSEAEQQALFDEYQALLLHRQQELIDAMLIYVSQTIGQVAQNLDVSIVVDQQVVLYGGVNMTPAVLAAIDADELAAIGEAVIAQADEESDDEGLTPFNLELGF